MINNNDVNTNNNTKRMLCKNMLSIGKCNYGDKCLYSHSMIEQKKDYFRETIYEYVCYVLANNENKIIFENILLYDKIFIKTLLILTKTCKLCEQKLCQGGYNCKYGVFDKKYQICKDDLYLKCLNKNNCQNVHLSNIGINLCYNDDDDNNNDNDINKLFLINKKKNKLKNKNKDIDIDIDLNIDSNSNSDSISENSYKRINDYLNEQSSDDMCEESIFIFK